MPKILTNTNASSRDFPFSGKRMPLTGGLGCGNMNSQGSYKAFNLLPQIVYTCEYHAL